MIRGLLITSCIVLLCGCQQISKTKENYWTTSDKQYLKSTEGAPLKVPEGLSFKQDTETYPLPKNLPAPGSVKPVSLEPPGFGKLDSKQ
jgi:uncharacterized lipoprotein